MRPREIISTADGSWSLYDPQLDETYHSRHGALQESEHVFIRNGLEVALGQFPGAALRILEMGLGSGLNALLTCRRLERLEAPPCFYLGLEAYPLAPEEYEALADCLPENLKAEKQRFLRLHQQAWGSQAQYPPALTLEKCREDIRDFYWNREGFHLVYYDAFAPNKQPDVWTEAVLQQMYELLQSGGLLVSYCAQGQFRRRLTNCGFQVYSLSGPPGKKEMTLASKGSLRKNLLQGSV